MSSLLPVIMAGGSGTRLWPLSREAYPKQFLSLEGESSMLQQTVNRLQGLTSSYPLIVTNESHRFLVAEQLRQINALKGNILLEPVGRNTAPAIALAALQAMSNGEDPLLLVLAADHIIRDVDAFQAAIKLAIPQAESGALVTFGIVPTSPETGYGYIHLGEAVTKGAWHVDAFVEKPDLATAQKYYESGDYVWNSGLFLFRASKYLEELSLHRPAIVSACLNAFEKQIPDMDFIRIDDVAFSACPADSIDYAVMEQTSQAVVVPMNVGWSDVGAFASLWNVLPHDAAGNATRGDVMLEDCSNCLVFAESSLVAAVGLQDVVVVQTKDAVLVTPKTNGQEIKRIVSRLHAEGRSEGQLNREVYRPWGKYDSIDNGDRYQVKRITVKPGAKLSVQMHHHRAEHWIVVSGTALVFVDKKEQLLTENQSIYIPIGSVHSLENPGKLQLELIEVQVGGYLEEDDIIRYEDRYGRY